MTVRPISPIGGGGGDIPPIDLPDGSIPKVVGGVLVESVLVEDSVEILSGLTIEAPAASLKLGSNMVLSNHGEIVQFSNSAYGDETLPVVAFHDDNGSLTPVDYKLEPFEINNSQPLDGDSFSGTSFQFEATAPLFRGTFLATPFGTLVLELTFRGDGVQTDGMRITTRIDSYSGPIIWQSSNEVEFNNGVGYTVNATGDTILRLEAPFILRDGENLFVTMDVLPTNIISLKGNVSTEFVPYLITKIQEVSRVPMATEEFATDAGATAWGEIGGTLADQTDLQTDLDLKEDKSQKGIANGYAPLDGSSHVPAANLPSYVDDVLEFANLAAFPVTGETGKIYIALDTNLTYRWSGTVYVELTDTTAVWGNVSGLLSNQTDLNNALAFKANKDGETITNASVNGVTLSTAGSTDYLAEDGTYKTLPAAAVSSVNSKTGVVVLDTDDISEATNLYYTELRVDANTNVSANTSHRGSTSNPHGVTGSQVGLGNADNTSDADKPISTATQTALDGKAQSGDNVSIFVNDASYLTSNAVDSVAGKTGVVTLVKADVGLGNVDNTSDADKPISTATQTALDDKLAAVSSDSSLTGVGTPGDPLSVVGGSVYGQNYESWESLAETINNTTTPFVKINADTAILPIGKYEIEATYSYKYEDGASMIYHAVLINDVITGTELQEEMKDNMNYMPSARKFNYVVTSAETINLKLQFRASTAGKKARMADAIVSIKRVE